MMTPFLQPAHEPQFRCAARIDEATLILHGIAYAKNRRENDERAVLCMLAAQDDPRVYEDAYGAPMPAHIMATVQAEITQWTALHATLYALPPSRGFVAEAPVLASRLVTIVRLLQLLRELVRTPPPSAYERRLQEILASAPGGEVDVE